MKITKEVLMKYNACTPLLEKVLDSYPDGAEVMDLLHDERLPREALHWGFKYLPVSKEEIEEYRKICNIKDSYFVYASENIEDCTAVSKSKNIKKSSYIKGSREISLSEDVYDSENIEISKDIQYSKDVSSSSFILDSENIEDSEYIVKSENITWGRNILYGKIIDMSSYLFQCAACVDCHFGNFLVECNHTLFCSNLKGKSYYIFNEPVSEDMFEYYRLMLIDNLPESSFFKLKEKLHNRDRINVDNNPYKLYPTLTPELLAQVSKFPNFTKDKFLENFYPENLQNSEI